MHNTAREAIQQLSDAGTEPWVSSQILREYLAALTREGVFRRPRPVPLLLADVRYFEGRFRVAEDGPHVTRRLLALLARIPAGGKQIHDANIVATMQAHGIPRLLTHNVADFARFGGVITVLPLV